MLPRIDSVWTGITCDPAGNRYVNGVTFVELKAPNESGRWEYVIATVLGGWVVGKVI